MSTTCNYNSMQSLYAPSLMFVTLSRCSFLKSKSDSAVSKPWLTQHRARATWRRRDLDVKDGLKGEEFLLVHRPTHNFIINNGHDISNHLRSLQPRARIGYVYSVYT